MLTTATARVAAAFTMLAFNMQELRERDREEGQALVEYGLIIALIAVVCIVAVALMGTEINSKLKVITDKLGAA